MMKRLLVTVLGASLSFASPLSVRLVTDTSGSIHPDEKVPDQVCVYICVDVNWEGYCQHICSPPGSCCKPRPPILDLEM